MKKKLLPKVLTLSLSLLFLTLSACSTDSNLPNDTPVEPSKRLAFTLNDDGESYSLSGLGGCPDTDIVIPLTYYDKPVTGISIYAFGYPNSKVTSVTILENITDIHEMAFINCNNVERITVSSKNKKYHSSGNCLIETATKTLIAACKNSVIPLDGSVTAFSEFAFSGCSKLTSITIPKYVPNLSGNLLHCPNLETITVESGNPNYYSKNNCIIETKTKTLIMGCKNSVIPVDGSVTSIGRAAFFNRNGLTSVTIPDSVTSIGVSAFSDCYWLTSANIGNGVTSIGDYAFYNCEKLESITIGNEVTSIGLFAFNTCNELESITVASENAHFKSNGNCLIENATKSLFLGCKNSVIPTDGSVTSIATHAFYNCRELTSITIPDSVTAIGDYAFAYCSELNEIKFNGTVSEWNAITRSLNWKNDDVPATQVICLNGTVDL